MMIKINIKYCLVFDVDLIEKQIDNITFNTFGKLAGST